MCAIAPFCSSPLLLLGIIGKSFLFRLKSRSCNRLIMKSFCFRIVCNYPVFTSGWWRVQSSGYKSLEHGVDITQHSSISTCQSNIREKNLRLWCLSYFVSLVLWNARSAFTAPAPPSRAVSLRRTARCAFLHWSIIICCGSKWLAARHVSVLYYRKMGWDRCPLLILRNETKAERSEVI